MRASPSIFTRIQDDCTELISLLTRLEDEIPEKRRNPHGGYGSGSGGHHPLAAWNAPAAMLVMDLHAGTRDLELELRYRISGSTRSRGSSSRNTERSLEVIPSLAAAVDYHTAQQVIARLESWIRRARLILGDAEPFSRLPRLPGQGDPVCPFCNTRGSLRVLHLTGAVRCLRPSCRASGRIEVGAYSQEPSLMWNDGTTGLPASGAVA